MEIRIIADIVAMAGFEEKFKKQLLELAEKSQSEDGCDTYTVHGDTTNPSRFFIYEIWKSSDALKKHENSPHFKYFLKSSESSLAKIQVHVISALDK